MATAVGRRRRQSRKVNTSILSFLHTHTPPFRHRHQPAEEEEEEDARGGKFAIRLPHSLISAASD